MAGLFDLSSLKVPTKRRAFFSFHFDDIMRVNVVRNAWKITHPDSPLMRSFYDSSLWESRKLEGDDAVKNLIRDGVERTSAICVLAGNETWSRRWCRYEIARAVIDGRGVLTVHLNSINPRLPRSHNPLASMAVGKVQASFLAAPAYYLFEHRGGEWHRYRDHTPTVKLPPYLADPAPGYVTPLSNGTMEYDFMLQQGHRNIGAWIDLAAQMGGR